MILIIALFLFAIIHFSLGSSLWRSGDFFSRIDIRKRIDWSMKFYINTNFACVILCFASKGNTYCVVRCTNPRSEAPWNKIIFTFWFVDLLLSCFFFRWWILGGIWWNASKYNNNSPFVDFNLELNWTIFINQNNVSYFFTNITKIAVNYSSHKL